MINETFRRDYTHDEKNSEEALKCQFHPYLDGKWAAPAVDDLAFCKLNPIEKCEHRFEYNLPGDYRCRIFKGPGERWPPQDHNL